ncbi:MAG: hypothetical protein AAF368_13240, partial [Planctomycetota bacterium]
MKHTVSRARQDTFTRGERGEQAEQASRQAIPQPIHGSMKAHAKRSSGDPELAGDLFGRPSSGEPSFDDASHPLGEFTDRAIDLTHEFSARRLLQRVCRLAGFAVRRYPLSSGPPSFLPFQVAQTANQDAAEPGQERLLLVEAIRPLNQGKKGVLQRIIRPLASLRTGDSPPEPQETRRATIEEFGESLCVSSLAIA